MNKYNFIYNPYTFNKYKITTKNAKIILNKYFSLKLGGAENISLNNYENETQLNEITEYDNEVENLQNQLTDLQQNNIENPPSLNTIPPSNNQFENPPSLNTIPFSDNTILYQNQINELEEEKQNYLNQIEDYKKEINDLQSISHNQDTDPDKSNNQSNSKPDSSKHPVNCICNC